MRTPRLIIAALAAICSFTAAGHAHAQSAPSHTEREAWRVNKTRELTRAYQEAYEAKDYKEAVRIAYELVRHDQQDGRSAYNLACAFALDGRLDDAAKWLRNAGTQGYDRPDFARRDADLESIREHPVYREALLVMRTNRSHALEQFKQWWDSQPLVVLSPEVEPEEPAPLIIALHGYGSSASDMVEYWRKPASDAGAVLVAPESGHQIDGRGGFQWSMDDETEWIIRRCVERVSARYPIDRERIVLTGFSQGGFVAIRHALEYPQEIAGVIPVAGLYDEDRTPFNEFKKKTPLPRFFLMVGEQDSMLEPMKKAERAFQERDADVELVVYPETGHAFPEHADEELARALAFVLKDKDTE